MRLEPLFAQNFIANNHTHKTKVESDRFGKDQCKNVPIDQKNVRVIKFPPEKTNWGERERKLKVCDRRDNLDLLSSFFPFSPSCTYPFFQTNCQSYFRVLSKFASIGGIVLEEGIQSSYAKMPNEVKIQNYCFHLIDINLA